VLLALTLVLATVGAAVGFVRLPYDSVAPGESQALNGLVSVVGHPAYPPRGPMLSTTVAVHTRVNPYEAFTGWVDPNVDVVEAQQLRGGLPDDEFEQLNQQAMSDSKTTAQVLALRHLGFSDLNAGARILRVEPGYPASEQLRAGDVIVAVDGQPVSTSDDAVTGLGRHRPGDTVRLSLRSDDRSVRELEVRLGGGEGERAVLGVRLTNEVKLPFEIRIESGEVVGPSAGLAYALEVLDVLTPGELTGGIPVAATGDLRPDGTVQPVGGVGQKAVSAARAGARVFLVPRQNLQVARAHAPRGLRVRPVGSFAEALEALSSLEGSNALALSRPGAGSTTG
jgi:PDZ domain-containing protein